MQTMPGLIVMPALLLLRSGYAFFAFTELTGTETSAFSLAGIGELNGAAFDIIKITVGCMVNF